MPPTILETLNLFVKERGSLFPTYKRLTACIKAALSLFLLGRKQNLNAVKNSWGFCDILPYSLCSPQIWYTLRLPKILLQQTGEEGLYYKTKKDGVVRLSNYFDIEENVVLRFLRLPEGGYHVSPYFKVNN